MLVGRLTDKICEWELPADIRCIDWDDLSRVVVCGHELGISILHPDETNTTQLNRQFIHLGIPTEKLTIHNKYIAAVHGTYTISLIDVTTGEIFKLEGRRGHSAPINSIDILPFSGSNNPLVVSTSDDMSLIVWQYVDSSSSYSVQQKITLRAAGHIVKFLANDVGKLLVLEGDHCIRIFDWSKLESIIDIYPGQHDGPVHDVCMFDRQLLVVGMGWWKSYDLNTISGGCGYTTPSYEGRLVVCSHKSNSSTASPRTRTSSDGRYVGYACTQCFRSYDMSKAGEYGVNISYNLHCDQLIDHCVHTSGSIAAAVGTILAIYMP